MRHSTAIQAVVCLLALLLLGCPGIVPSGGEVQDESIDESSPFDTGDTEVDDLIDLAADADAVEDGSDPTQDVVDTQDQPTDPVEAGDPVADIPSPDMPADSSDPDAADLSDRVLDQPSDSSDASSYSPCDTSADCTLAGETCGLFSDGEGGIERLCHQRIGDSELGPCTGDDTCRTGICIGGGFCYWACANNDDCEGDYECGTITFLSEGSDDEIEVPGCVPPLRTCTNALDCLPLETCQVFGDTENPNQIIQYCDVATGTLDSGAVCTQDDQCKTNDCLAMGDGTSRCVGPCNPVTQQGCALSTHCYPDIITVTFDQGTEPESDDVYDAFDSCMDYFGSYMTCESDADCAPADDDETCMITYNATQTGFEQRCIFPSGAGRGGATCTTDGECRADWCLSASYCFGLCDMDGEGSAECVGTTTCQTVQITVDDRGTVSTADDIIDDIDICWP